MTSNAVDSHSPAFNVHRSSESVLNKKDEKVEESDDNKVVQKGKDNSVATQTSMTMPTIDVLGCGNHKAVKDDGGGISNKAVQISPDESGVDENSYEVIYSYPPDILVLNINGQMRFELVTVRENGRLQISMVPYRWPQLVRSPLRNGRLRMWFLNDDQYGGSSLQDRHTQDPPTVD